MLPEQTTDKKMPRGRRAEKTGRRAALGSVGCRWAACFLSAERDSQAP